MSWIMLPASVDVEPSVDGNQFEKAGSLLNDQARERLPRQIRTLRVDLSTPVRARYIRVTAATIGRLPAWRGPDGEAWVFVDEIMVE